MLTRRAMPLLWSRCLRSWHCTGRSWYVCSAALLKAQSTIRLYHEKLCLYFNFLKAAYTRGLREQFAGKHKLVCCLGFINSSWKRMKCERQSFVCCSIAQYGCEAATASDHHALPLSCLCRCCAAAYCKTQRCRLESHILYSMWCGRLSATLRQACSSMAVKHICNDCFPTTATTERLL